MIDTMNLDVRTRLKRPSLLVFKILVMSFAGLITNAVWRVEPGRPIQWIFATLFLYSVASLVFRWNWGIPCIVTGTIFGFFAGNAVKGCDIKSEAVAMICVGFVGGFVIGCLFDQFESNVYSRCGA